MGDRKEVNKYIPPDFDPAKVPRGKKLSTKDGTVPVRMMLPFTICCDTCHAFMYRGRKFNSKKERMGGPDGTYLGITRFRFYIKCASCARPITFLTDPQNADYEMESGGTRNYEVYKDKAQHEENEAVQKEELEKQDPMAALENRVLDSQREMAELDQLETIKAMNAKHVQMKDVEAVLAVQHAREVAAAAEPVVELTEEDEALVRSIQFGPPSVKRLDESDEARMEDQRKKQAEAVLLRQTNASSSEQRQAKLPLFKLKRKRPVDNNVTVASTSDPSTDKKAKAEGSNFSDVPAKEAQTTNVTNGGLGLSGLLGGYGSDEESD